MNFSPELIDRLAHDPHRPQYHFLPPANWMNDPNGLIQWQGQYHMFYQHNPDAPVHGNIHWGHAVSSDLVHWAHLPAALTPGAGEHDEGGCWSGCTVDNQGVPTILYTGVSPQVVCMATSSDDLLTWQKFEGNPIIPGLPKELVAKARGDFRDPFVWEEDGYWYLIMGTQQEGQGGMILLYRSQDLFHWEYLNPLLVGDITQQQPFWTGAMWECPNFLNLGERRALITSIQSAEWNIIYPIYFTGIYKDHKFVPETQEVLDYGGYFYAPLTMRDDQGRNLMWGWIREGRSLEAQKEAGWAGIMSVPIVLSLGKAGKLKLEPAPELEKLRQEHWRFEELMLTTGPEIAGLLDQIQGNCLEILAEIEPDATGEFGFNLCCSPDGEEQTRLVLRLDQQQILIERENSSLNLATDRKAALAPLELLTGEPVKLHIFLDRSVLEVFVNDQTYLSSRIYPTRADSLGFGLWLKDGNVRFKSLDIWTMASIWK